jgi:dCMP deaminase
MLKYTKFIAVAQAFAGMSKDPSTQVGAIALDDKMNVVSAGYNGFPRGVKDLPARYLDRETKYRMVSHAEANLVAQAAYGGRSLAGCTVIVLPLPPCSSCAKLLIQAGVARVLYQVSGDTSRWEDSFKLSKLMFDEAGVGVHEILADSL